MKWFAALLLVFSVSTEYRCVRWTWSGDVYSRKVICLEWKKVERK
jgi:hypothetical protein